MKFRNTSTLGSRIGISRIFHFIQEWPVAHLSIYRGCLTLRRGDVLMVCDIDSR